MLQPKAIGSKIGGWLEEPTQGLVMHYSFTNISINCKMLLKLILIKTEGGLWELDFNSQVANILMFD